MEVSKEPGYYYQKTYLYSSRNLPDNGNGPWGSAELTIDRAKGLLVCQTSEWVNKLLAPSPGAKFFMMVSNESTGEQLSAGELIPYDDDGRRFIWEFNAAYSGVQKRVDPPLLYHIKVVAGQGSTAWAESGGTMMQGVFSLPYELRDSRIVGFKKEGTVKRPSPEAWEKNPIIQKVEPFEPPIPNTVWWQISVQPDFRDFRQVDFCPRQKSYKAVF